MAEYMLRDRLEDSDRTRFQVTSAGVAARRGRPASQPAVAVLKEVGIDSIVRHSSRPAETLDLTGDDLILTMTRGHLLRLPKRFRESTIETFTLKEYVGRSGGISDPFGAPVSRYRELREELDPLIDAVYRRLKDADFEVSS